MHGVCRDKHLVPWDVSEGDIVFFIPLSDNLIFDGGCILNSWVRTSTYAHTGGRCVTEGYITICTQRKEDTES